MRLHEFCFTFLKFVCRVMISHLYVKDFKKKKADFSNKVHLIRAIVIKTSFVVVLFIVLYYNVP